MMWSSPLDLHDHLVDDQLVAILQSGAEHRQHAHGAVLEAGDALGPPYALPDEEHCSPGERSVRPELGGEYFTVKSIEVLSVFNRKYPKTLFA